MNKHLIVLAVFLGVMLMIPAVSMGQQERQVTAEGMILNDRSNENNPIIKRGLDLIVLDESGMQIDYDTNPKNNLSNGVIRIVTIIRNEIKEIVTDTKERWR